MRRLILLVTYCLALSACMTTRPSLTSAPSPWDQRLQSLRNLRSWQLDGRAAVAVGTQGWQASLNWHQVAANTEVHLAGPLGIGALTLKRTPQGLSLNGAPPGDAVSQVQDRLGFELPLDNLRYWLLGAPDPASPFELVRNDQDRAKQVVQAGWTVDYDRYMPVNGDLLPAHLVLSREGVRVRIAVDHWEGMK
jgi:outer membrane lipoprotein LolB